MFAALFKMIRQILARKRFSVEHRCPGAYCFLNCSVFGDSKKDLPKTEINLLVLFCDYETIFLAWMVQK